jgi:predicted lipid-binding transport protein (Tim44 family)
VPESKGRAKPTHTPPPSKPSKKTMANPPWFVPVMLGLMLVGLLWVVTFYITEGKFPIPNVNYWNLIIGFGLMISGFMMTTRWR